MEPKRDYYEVLEVPRDADAKTIKRAFLKKARTLHPDVNKEPDAEERFKEVNEAYAVLSDDQKRANYDRYGDPNGPAGFGSDYVDVSDIFGGGGFGFGDIFDSFFGGGAGRAGAQARTRGRDMGIRLTVTLEEAAAGCKKTVAYTRLAPCEDCGGTGAAEGGRAHACERCHGTGRVVEVQRTIFGQMQTQATCPVCHGQGQVIDHPCETCEGQGRAPSREKVEVQVPAGVHSGQTITVSGKGEAGVRGDASGDLVVSIEVAESDRFERRGDDLYCTVRVDALQAIVGTTVALDGIMEGERVTVEVPAGCQFGQQVVVERKGMPRMGMIARGNLVAVVQVETPRDLTKKQLLDVAAIVAERALDEGAAAERDARPEPTSEEEAEGFSAAAENAAEHFAKERWHAPKNPFRSRK
ncbi:molecular chaperone DnaJ [Thermophilibacter sp. ET337]|uniref:molecular chaperone DnaJ n=1 Tax=Thermophilibacter sp. ET337 TaxID=2973084 RepID=UPI0021ABF5AD|nr:molecular chaperone DnaJ [Thermophilibacter sp. ET337]MCR8907481.1 molecular chaperone DnaJ [Thermophilibacter sp. ET337]